MHDRQFWPLIYCRNAQRKNDWQFRPTRSQLYRTGLPFMQTGIDTRKPQVDGRDGHISGEQHRPGREKSLFPVDLRA